MNTDKIELKYVAPYLPYGLKIQYEGIINGKEISQYDKEFRKNNPSNDDWLTYKPVAEIKGLKMAEVKELKLYKGYWKLYAGVYRGGLKSFYSGIGFKPILRPLSDLTEPEIIDLFKSGMAEDVLEALSKAHNFGGYTSGQTLRIYDINQGVGITIPNYSIVSYSISTCQFTLIWGFRYNEWDVFQKMFEMHLDVFGLIESGLAIDINTVPKQ